MSYWTYSDLFEEPGPPTAPFQGGFGLLNPKEFASRHSSPTSISMHFKATGRDSDPQAMLAVKDGDVAR